MRPLVLVLFLTSCGPEDPAIAKRDPATWKEERMSPVVAAPVRSSDERIRQAEELVRQERLAEAGTEYRAVLVANPKSIPALVGLSRLSTRMNDPAATSGFMARAVELNPQDGALVNELAVAQVQLGRRKDAAVIFEKARELSPEDPLISINASLNYADLGDWAQAQRCIEHAASKLPQEPTPWLLMGRFQMRQGKNAAAIPHLQEAAKRGPRDGIVHYHLGKALIAENRKRDAAAAFQIALQSDPPVEIRQEIEKLLK